MNKAFKKTKTFYRPVKSGDSKPFAVIAKLTRSEKRELMIMRDYFTLPAS